MSGKEIALGVVALFVGFMLGISGNETPAPVQPVASKSNESCVSAIKLDDEIMQRTGEAIGEYGSYNLAGFTDKLNSTADFINAHADQRGQWVAECEAN